MAREADGALAGVADGLDDDEADVLPAAAFEHAGTHGRHRVHAGERADKRGRGDDEG